MSTLVDTIREEYQRCVNQHQDTVTFYRRGQKYYEFTNFYQCWITLWGCRASTSEHFFQAAKFPKGSSVWNRIINAPSARNAFNIARSEFPKLDHSIQNEWHTQKKFLVMHEILYAKFTQHSDLAKMLLSTGDSVLIEASDVDACWGWGKYRDGENWLGKILMYIRKQLRDSGSYVITTTAETCNRPGCTRSRNVENGRVHDYCSITCAHLTLYGECNRPGCNKPRYNDGRRVHDYCSRTCAAKH